MLNFAFENLVAVNFVNLDKSRALAVLEARNMVREFMLTSREIGEAEHFRFIESLRDDKKNAYFAVYAIDSANAESSAFLGVICLNQIDFANKNAFLGIYANLTANPATNHTTNHTTNNGANLLKILKFIAFDELNLHILYAKVLSTNSRALRFYDKNGFVRCGKLIEAIKRGDKFLDLEILALKSQVPSLRGSPQGLTKQSKQIKELK
ncbi:UDP-4-amino-4,6-dideoxy-N-acetyl-beta-L-altrosamine N-acetyltransferase [Helicobacter sp. 23-1044]